MTDPVMAPETLEFTLELSAPRARVWKAIADPAELQRWFPDRAEYELAPGSTGSLTWEGVGEGRSSYAIRIETVDEPSYLAWRWSNHVDMGIEADGETTLVEWWLSDRPGGGTMLRLRESGFTRPEHRDGNERGWTAELGELEELLA